MAAINNSATPSKVTPNDITFSLKPNGGSSATLAGTILNFNVEEVFELEQSTINTAGIPGEERFDGRRFNLTGTLRYLNSITVFPAIGDQITVANTDKTSHDTIYFITQLGTAYEFGKYIDISVTAHKREGITLS